MDAFDSTPRLAFLSPEPASGKTRALEATEPLVPRPVEAVNVTAPYIFRKVGGKDGRPTILYDGQGIMVPIASGVETLADLDGATICITSGTTTELNLADVMGTAGSAYESFVAAETDTVYGTYDEGTCDAVSADRSQLLGRQSTLADPSAHVILEETFSKEPLGPVTPHGDNQWTDIVTWVVNATIAAEELGIDSTNIDSFAGNENPVVQRLLGEIDDLGTALGLSNDFVINVITAVGNYGEIYDRSFGPDALNLPRGLNELWTNGGLLYSPPFS